MAAEKNEFILPQDLAVTCIHQASSVLREC